MVRVRNDDENTVDESGVEEGSGTLQDFLVEAGDGFERKLWDPCGYATLYSVWNAKAAADGFPELPARCRHGLRQPPGRGRPVRRL